MKNKFFAIIGTVVFIMGLFLTLRIVDAGRISELIGKDSKADFKPAPDFTLFDVNGDRKKLSDFKGKVIVLDFWTTWCPSCMAKVPSFIELYNEYKDRGFEIIAVSLDLDEGDAAGSFVEKKNINYTVLLGTNEVSELYGDIISVPTTFIIDREGKIRKRFIGFRDKDVFEKLIKELL